MDKIEQFTYMRNWRFWKYNFHVFWVAESKPEVRISRHSRIFRERQKTTWKFTKIGFKWEVAYFESALNDFDVHLAAESESEHMPAYKHCVSYALPVRRLLGDTEVGTSRPLLRTSASCSRPNVLPMHYTILDTRSYCVVSVELTLSYMCWVTWISYCNSTSSLRYTSITSF